MIGPELEVTGYVSQPYGGTRLLAVDSGGRVVPIHPDRLTEDLRGTTIRCTCAEEFPTLGTERVEHLSSCPLFVLADSLEDDDG